MKKASNNRYLRLFFSWLTLLVYLLLAFVILITIETLTREYPKWHWWMGTVPVNIFSDAFMPVVVSAIVVFSIPFGIITLPPVLSYTFQWNKTHQVIEVVCYLLSIGFLWFGFWVTGWAANCQMLSLASDGGPWGPCGYWIGYSRPVNNLIWHSILWIIWLVGLVYIWKIVKRMLILEQENVLIQGVLQ